MPSDDVKKSNFISKCFNKITKYDSDIEDIFQGLDASYKSINEFLINQKTPSDHHQTVLNEIADIIVNSGGKALTMKMDTVMRVLRATADMGGNLSEQLYYLSKGSKISLSNPSFIEKTKDNHLNVLYNSDVVSEDVDKLLKKADIIKDKEKKKSIESPARIISYLSKIPPHQRPAIDYINRYFNSEKNREFQKGLSINENLKIIHNAINKFGHNIHDTKYFKDHRVEREINDRMVSFYNAHREDRFHYISGGLSLGDVSLIRDYTGAQVRTNNVLLNLNILSSTGNNYDPAYPDGEFSNYLSVFDIMFEDMGLKLTEDIMVNVIEESKSVIKNADKMIYELSDNTIPVEKDDSVKKKEIAHEAAVNKFVEIYKQRPTLNFHQVIGLGLVSNLVENSEKLLKNAKSLYQYDQYFSQALRTIIATDAGGQDKFDKLKRKANNIARTIDFLTQDTDRGAIHRILTNKGKNPENIALFACFFGKEEELTLEKVDLFLNEVNNLTHELKIKLLDRYKFNPLPFQAGEILDSNFPQLKLSDISNSNRLIDLINSSYDKTDYKDATRFNDISLDSREKGILDLRNLEQKYGDKINIPLLSYKDLKNKIISNENYILVEIVKSNSDNVSLQDLSKDILNTMLMVKSDVKNRGLVELEVELIFNPKLSFNKQILDIERTYTFLQKIFKNKKVNQQEFLNLLHREPSIPKEKIGKLLKFLSDIDISKLAAKNYTLNQLIEESGNELLGNNFESFKLATELFLEKEATVNFTQISKLLNKLIENNYSTKNIKQIFSYCSEHNDYKAFELFSLVSGRTNNIDKTVNQITEISPQDLELINKKIPLDKLFKLSPMLKMQNMIKTIIKYKESITDENYISLYNNIRNKRKDIYSENIFSYLLAPQMKVTQNSEEAKFIFNNLNDIDQIKLYFSKQNLERFKYKEKRLRKIIDELKDLNKIENQEFTQENKDLFYKSLESIYIKAREFSSLTDSELKEEATKLKHKREILVDNSKEELLENDLKFVALMAEVSYRKAKMFPRDTQLLSILTVVLTEGHLNQQISTGQGKTWITAWNAAYLAYTGQTIFVATSNHQLSRRDLKEVRDMFDGLGLKSSDKVITVDSDTKELERGKIMYSTHADIALYISQIEFNKVDGYKELLARITLLSDEVDAAFKSPIHYKLALPLVSVSNNQAKILFKFILDYMESDVFKKNLSIESHIHNLKENIKQRFSQVNPSYEYPLSKYNKDKLSKENSDRAIELLDLNVVLTELDKQKGGLDYSFKKLLLASQSAKKLQENNHYIIPKEEPGKLINALPLIGSRVSKETRFGNGVQSFLHLLIEREHPELIGKIDYNLPSSVIFDLTPKNLHDKIHLAGGRHIGFSGTLGDAVDLDEFHTVLGSKAVAIPDFQESKRIIETTEASNESDQQKLLLDNIDKIKDDRPILIFVEGIDEVSKIHDLLKDKRKGIQTADANIDNDTLDIIGSKAGERGKITISTRIMGRGNDFQTDHPEGFVELNLCTEVTHNELCQMFGRVARNGKPGYVLHIPNKEKYIGFEDHNSFMTHLAKQEAESRSKVRPEFDTKLYFNKVNAGSQIDAIQTNEFISESWAKILKDNNKSVQKQTPNQLQEQLIKMVDKKYPEERKSLLEFLAKINDHNKEYTQRFDGQLLEDIENNDSIKITSKNFPTNWKTIDILSRRIPIKDVEPPKESDPAIYKVFYDVFYEAQMNVIITHLFELLNSTLPIETDYVEEPILLDTNNNLDKEYVISGEGSSGNLMSSELKESFAAYKKHNTNNQESTKLEKFSSIINKLGNTDLTKLKYGQYQPFRISVLVTSQAGHAVSILTDGKFIVVVNRGYGAKDSGLKLYKVNKNVSFDKFKSVLSDISGSNSMPSLTNTHSPVFNNGGLDILQNSVKIPTVTYAEFEKAIHSIVENNPSTGTPSFIQVDMKAQKIGNCGWAQVEGLLMATGLVGSLDSNKALPKEDSYELQEAIRYAEDLYQDFVKFDRLHRIEHMLYTIDPKFTTKYLPKNSKEEIDGRRDHLVNPIDSKLLEKVTKAFEEEINIYANSVYENDAKELLQKIKIEDFFRSEAGVLFVEEVGELEAREQISILLVEEINQLKSLYSDNIKPITDDKNLQRGVIKSIINYITSDSNIDGEELIKNLKNILDPKMILNREAAPLNQAILNAANNNDLESVKILIGAIGLNNFDIDFLKTLSERSEDNIKNIVNERIEQLAQQTTQNIEDIDLDIPSYNILERVTGIFGGLPVAGAQTLIDNNKASQIADRQGNKMIASSSVSNKAKSTNEVAPAVNPISFDNIVPQMQLAATLGQLINNSYEAVKSYFTTMPSKQHVNKVLQRINNEIHQRLVRLSKAPELSKELASKSNSMNKDRKVIANNFMGKYKEICDQTEAYTKEYYNMKDPTKEKLDTLFKNVQTLNKKFEELIYETVREFPELAPNKKEELKKKRSSRNEDDFISI